MPKWPWEEKKEEDKVELPKELEDRFSSVKTDVTTEVNKKIDERFQELAPVLEFARIYKEDRETERLAREEAVRKKTEKPDETDEDMAARLLSDPRGVINDATRSQSELLLQVRADNIRRDVFQDRASDFPYYDGEIKREVNELLAKQSLKFQNDPASIENVYHTVVGRRMKDINEGKLKTRFAAAGPGLAGGPNSNDGDNKRTIKVTPDIEKAARLTGMKVEDYVKALEVDEEFDYAG